ncbi:hypothetical protein HN51_050116 [Arachis hypogaea]|uniref:Transmembrane protein n=1 Tax=Arachis hypogaea TaxID=3818 RepID=A0A444YCN7_ARAHY|nr:uncharacterized protein LOC107608365 [Arachis ipaensis]XP_025667072.1 uncharacterized protein LOC112765388 [Arachis hypogaea]QHN91778.1 uncharacterized protein DS421_17g577860 [Arachis hypogaea]RYQ99682.1 hypothetical protein Ahy_B07g087656 [Arachis hypogaea]
MARPLLLASSMPKTTPFLVLLSIFSIFSVITFLCGTRKMKKFKARALESASSKKNKLVTKINSNLSNRAVSSMAKMLSWRKVQATEEEEEEQEEIFYSSDDHDQHQKDDEAIWKKNILMGERCRPVDFSGKIIYDAHGNLVRDLSRD